MLNKGTTGTIFITSLVWRGPWLGIEPGTSRTRSQHYITRLSRRRSCSVDNCYSYHVGSEKDVTCNLSDIDESCQSDNWYSKHVKDNDTLHSFHTKRFNSSNVHFSLDCFHCFQTAQLVIHIHTHVLMLYIKMWVMHKRIV